MLDERSTPLRLQDVMAAPAIAFDATPADSDDSVASVDLGAPSPDNGAAAPELASTDEQITVIQLRSPSQTGTSRDDSRRNRRLWIGGLAAAAAAAVLVVVGFVVATGDDDPTVEVGPPTVAESDDLLTQRTAVIEEATRLYSEGRLDDLDGLLADGLGFTGARRPLVESVVAANDQWTLEGPCQASPTAVFCPMAFGDDFHGAGGLEVRGNVSFRFNEANKIREVDIVQMDGFLAYDAFDKAFATWFAENHPEAAAEYGPFLRVDIDSDPYMPDAEDMVTALQYVDEFVAQSDKYPIDPGANP